MKKHKKTPIRYAITWLDDKADAKIPTAVNAPISSNNPTYPPKVIPKSIFPSGMLSVEIVLKYTMEGSKHKTPINHTDRNLPPIISVNFKG